MSAEENNQNIVSEILRLCVRDMYALPDELREVVIAYQNAKASSRVNVLDMKVSEIPMSIRASNVLYASNCVYVKDVVNLGLNNLGVMRNCGKKTVDEIRQRLRQVGIEIPQNGTYKPMKEAENPKREEVSEDGKTSNWHGVKRLLNDCEDALFRAKMLVEKETGSGLVLNVADSMFETIREVENDHRTQCTCMLDGTCNEKCKNFGKCWWRKLRGAADDYETVRK